jgi:hypothetical protein
LPPRASTSGESTPGEETRQAIANAAGRYRTPKRTTPIVILFHAAFNSFTRFFLSELQGSHYVVAWWTLSGLVTLLAVAVVAYAGSQNLARGHTKPVYEPKLGAYRVRRTTTPTAAATPDDWGRSGAFVRRGDRDGRRWRVRLLLSVAMRRE